MKRFVTLMIISLILSVSLFADTSVLGIGAPDESSGAASVEVGFTFDPKTMFRVTFGFTEETELHWDSVDGDMDGKSFYLTTQNSPYDVDSFFGQGSVNFYWKLRTPQGVKASIYLDSPMVDQNGNNLDYEIQYTSDLNGIGYIYNISKYGKENAKPIYEKEADPEMNVVIDYTPIDIKTSSIKVGSGNRAYSSNIGVLVQVV